MKKLEISDVVLITNLNPRLSTLDNKTIDLYANRNTIITKKDEDINFQGEVIKNIKELQNSKGMISFKGIITSVDNLKTISLKYFSRVFLI